MTEFDRAMAAHYSRGTLLADIVAALAAVGLTPETATADDLAPVDHFHIAGRLATAALAEQLGFGAGDRVLDIGSGLGGPARMLATSYGCHATGLDQSSEYVEVARAISDWLGLADRTRFEVGDAAALPFEDNSFDGAMMMAVAMNIPDKLAWCAEVARVLRPGAVFGLFEIMRMGDGEIRYPMPWASDPVASFVETADDYRRHLAGAGFTITAECERSEFGTSFFHKMRARLSDAGPGLTLPLVLGPAAGDMAAHMIAAIDGRIIAPIEMIARAPA